VHPEDLVRLDAIVVMPSGQRVRPVGIGAGRSSVDGILAVSGVPAIVPGWRDPGFHIQGQGMIGTMPRASQGPTLLTNEPTSTRSMERTAAQNSLASDGHSSHSLSDI